MANGNDDVVEEPAAEAVTPVHVPGAVEEPTYASEMSDIELRDRALAFIRKMIQKGSVATVQSRNAQYALLAHFDKGLRDAILSTGVDSQQLRICWRRGYISFLEELTDDEQ